MHVPPPVPAAESISVDEQWYEWRAHRNTGFLPTKHEVKTSHGLQFITYYSSCTTLHLGVWDQAESFINTQWQCS